MNEPSKRTTGVLLLNLGTPDSPKVGDVTRYLLEFLNDPRVIDLPFLSRKLLVNLVIVPTRVRNSSKIYQQLWDENQGKSPLLVYGNELVRKMQSRFSEEKVRFHLAMRYGKPSIPEVLNQMYQYNYDEIFVVPLYPHYASATNGSTAEEVMRCMKNWYIIPELRFTGQFYSHPGFINGFAKNARKFDLDQYDHFLFSYHGLPVRQVDKAHQSGDCESNRCRTEINEQNKHCYLAASFHNTRLLVNELGLDQSKVTTAFQSRLDKEWLEPFSDKVVIEQAKKGTKRILAFSPAFVADCLETLIEIEDEYNELFREHGGEVIHMVPSLNAEDYWVDTLIDIIGLQEGGN